MLQLSSRYILSISPLDIPHGPLIVLVCMFHHQWLYHTLYHPLYHTLLYILPNLLSIRAGLRKLRWRGNGYYGFHCSAPLSQSMGPPSQQTVSYISWSLPNSRHTSSSLWRPDCHVIIGLGYHHSRLGNLLRVMPIPVSQSSPISPEPPLHFLVHFS